MKKTYYGTMIALLVMMSIGAFTYAAATTQTSLTFNLSTEDYARTVTAFTKLDGYQENITLENGTIVTNPVSSDDFTKIKIMEFIKGKTREYEVRKAQEEAALSIQLINIT